MGRVGAYGGEEGMGWEMVGDDRRMRPGMTGGRYHIALGVLSGSGWALRALAVGAVSFHYACSRRAGRRGARSLRGGIGSRS